MSPAPRRAALSRCQVLGLLRLSLTYSLLSVAGAGAASLSDALDNPNLFWRASSDTPWLSQTAETHDGVDAAQSAAIPDGQESWIEATFTGPALVTFWWKVSSELGYDELEFLIDDEEQISISGEVPWELRFFDLPEGAHVLRWRYVKDSTQSAGLDHAWLDEISYTPPADFPPMINEQPLSYTVAAGANVTFSVGAAALPLPTFQWFHNGNPIPLATNSSLTLINVTVSDAGTYTVLIRNPLGSTNSEPATLTVTVVGDAVEAPELNWLIGGDGAWFGQTAVTHDGVDALQSGAIVNQQESWVQTRVTGPGVLSFWWKVSSEPFYDGLQFLTNNGVAASLSAEAVWEQQVFTFPPGIFTLRWRYFKDSSITIGQDRGWLDQVTYIPNKAPTNLVVNLSRQAIFENDSITLDASFFDPDTLDAHTLLVNWRDGSSTTNNLPPGVYSFSATHQFRDDDPTASSFDNYQVTVSVSDQAGTVTGIYPLTVSNSPPLLSALAFTTTLFPYDTAVVSGTISDIGPLDPLRIRMVWGDSTNIESFDYSPGTTSFVLRHRYNVANSNAQVTLTATDDDLGVRIVRTNIFIRPFPARPRIVSLRKGTAGNSVVRLQGTAQANYQVQRSSDLVHWTTIAIRTSGVGGLFEVDDPGGFTYQRCFYRAIWESQSAGVRFSAIGNRTNGLVGVQLLGLPGASYRIDSSTNLLNWTPFIQATTMDSNGFFNFTDSPSQRSRKFYRAVLP